MKKVATFASIALVLAVLLPGAALASGGSTCAAYNPQLCPTGATTPTTTTVTTTSTSTLPFTGLDIGLLLAGGLVLLGAGFAVRIASQRMNN